MIKTGFKTKKFNSNNIDDDYKRLFGDIDFSQFDGELCFDNVSNVDLIFSNILYKDDNVYIIDYEWVFDFSILLDFVFFRAFFNTHGLKEENYFSEEKLSIYRKNEEQFIFHEVAKNISFYTIQHKFLKKRVIIDHEIQELKQQVNDLVELLEYVRLKNRLKRLIPNKITSVIKNIMSKCDRKNSSIKKQ